MEATYFRKGFGLKAEIQETLRRDYHSGIVAFFRERGNVVCAGGLTARLAAEFGFCYGVDRAVEYAYETRRRFPDRRIFLTNEIIHNPHVNQNLKDMGIVFLNSKYRPGETWDEVSTEDVVILPAFGVPAPHLATLKAKGCVLVDTTCGSVINVWKNVERYAKEGFTSVIHGKHWHEETLATCSRVTAIPGGRYLVVRDLEEAEAACLHIEKGRDRASFLERFAPACSADFDPDRDLSRLGLANQTTMLMSESLAIGRRFEEALARRHGPDHPKTNLRTFDTICSATQDRQDAVLRMVEEGVDLVIVIGGYNSSNTTHLAEMARGKAPAYHIADPSCLVSASRIRHKPVGQSAETEAKDWLVEGPCTVGFTAGASTPNNKVGEAIERVFALKGVDLKAKVSAEGG